MIFETLGATASIINACQEATGSIFDENGLLDGSPSAVRVRYGEYSDEIGQGYEELFISNAFITELVSTAFPKEILEVKICWSTDENSDPNDNVLIVEAAAEIGWFITGNAGTGESQNQIFTSRIKLDGNLKSSKNAGDYENDVIDKLKHQLNFFGIDTSQFDSLEIKGGMDS